MAKPAASKSADPNMCGARLSACADLNEQTAAVCKCHCALCWRNQVPLVDARGAAAGTSHDAGNDALLLGSCTARAFALACGSPNAGAHRSLPSSSAWSPAYLLAPAAAPRTQSSGTSILQQTARWQCRTAASCSLRSAQALSRAPHGCGSTVWHATSVLGGQTSHASQATYPGRAPR